MSVSYNKRLNALLRNKKRSLIEQAENLGGSFSYSNSSKRQVAEYILEQQDQEKIEPVDDQSYQSEFDELTEPDDVPVIEEKRGGSREGAGRPEGQTEVHTRVERCREIKKSDPTVFFFVSGLFSFWALRTNVMAIASDCDDQAESLALSITKFMRYQWPDLRLDPRLEFGAGICKELRSSFLWGKQKIDKARGEPSGPVIRSEDVSDEVFHENDNERSG